MSGINVYNFVKTNTEEWQPSGTYSDFTYSWMNFYRNLYPDLRPEQHQPSGHVDFNRIMSVNLHMQTHKRNDNCQRMP